jgi:hypothetical protein
VLCVVLIKKVVDPNTELQLLAQLVATIERKHLEPSALVEILTDNISAPDVHAILLRH